LLLSPQHFNKYNHGVGAMAPKQSRHDGGADLALRQQLAEIKKVSLEEVGRIRMTPEKMPSLVDVVVILTEQASKNAALTVQRLLQAHPDLTTKCSQIKFGGRGNQDTPVPKNLATLIEIIFLLPGRSAAKVRQSAAQIFVRYLGGDLSLIHEVERMNHVQTFLRENDPEHPLRAFGEYAEQRQAEEAIPEARRREEMELALGHKKRMLELEFEDKKAELAAKKARFEQEAEVAQKKAQLEEDVAKKKAQLEEDVAKKKAQLEEDVAKKKAQLEEDVAKKKAQQEEQQKQDEVHEEFRRQRASTITANLGALKVLLPNQQPLSPRSMRVVQDELRTGLLGRERPDASLGKPVYCSRFLQEQLFLKDWAAKERAKVFGNDVKTAVRAMFPDYDLDARTNRSVDGHDREPHLYFETHLPAFFAALPRYVARAAEVKDDELTREGLQKKRAGSEQSMRNFFRPG
jgi:DNA segregation ATPase FtsK/SpoIIIE-like protein